jgi:hypothetical protein
MATIGTPTRLTPGLYTCEVNEDSACIGCAYGATAEDAQRRAAQFAAAHAALELAREVAKDCDDAADWTDARGRLYRMAQSALAVAGE